MLPTFLKESYNMPKYLQVHFKGNEKLELARIAVEMRSNMTEIVRLALVEFLIKHKSLPDGSIHQNPNKPETRKTGEVK